MPKPERIPTLAQWTATLVLVVCFGSAGLAQSEVPRQSGAHTIQLQLQLPTEQPQIRYQELVEQLTAFEQDTLANRPDLQEDYEALQLRAIATMEQRGHDPKGILERLTEISQDLLAAPSDTPEQLALLKDFEAQRIQLALAEQDALQDEELRSAHTAFQENLLAAQRERHPETDALLVELLALQQQIQDSDQKASGTPR